MFAVGRSAYEHLRHIQVSPTYKRQTKAIFTHVRTYPLKVSLLFYLTRLLIPKFIQGGKWKNFIQVSAFVES